MTDTVNLSLGELVAIWQLRVKQRREAGDLGALLAVATAAADEIEERAGEGLDDPGRQALLTVKRFTYNAAADCWPGWSIPKQPADRGILLLAQALAQRSAALVTKLKLGPLHEGTGIWLCGAFDLALGRHAEAAEAFALARERYLAAEAPGLVLLTEGYSAIVRAAAGQPADGTDLQQVTARIAAGGFEDDAEWIEQLRIARQVFVP